MAFPELLRRLFDHDGAGPNLRWDILPENVALCTQDEYDALGPGKLTDGRLYVIVQGKDGVFTVAKVILGNEVYAFKGGEASVDINWAIEAPGYPSQFMNFMEQSPPKGWRVRNGATLVNADVDYPELWLFLQARANAWKCKTAAQWSALSSAAGGVGGAPFFVLNVEARTIRLPDTRGDYERCSGGGTMGSVGGWHPDAIRNITGWFANEGGSSYGSGQAGGAFYISGVLPGTTGQPGGSEDEYHYFDAARVVPTAAENRTRAFGVLGCVYVGGN
jgi:hypothetical protein